MQSKKKNLKLIISIFNRFRPSFKMCTHISENEIYSLDQEPFFIVQKTQKKNTQTILGNYESDKKESLV